jgi:transcriptional regulator with XRE-family HTH domain
MVNQDLIIANNIVETLKFKNIKQSKLAENLNIPRQTVNKMLNGSRGINASELKDIAIILDTTMDKLCKVSEKNLETNVFRKIVDKVDEEDAKQTILIADELINMLLFHRNAAKEFEKKKKVVNDNE